MDKFAPDVPRALPREARCLRVAHAAGCEIQVESVRHEGEADVPALGSASQSGGHCPGFGRVLREKCARGEAKPEDQGPHGDDGVPYRVRARERDGHGHTTGPDGIPTIQ